MHMAGAARWTAVLAFCLALSVEPAYATGPGGWDHLGTGTALSTAPLDGRVDALLSAAPDALLAGGVFTRAGATDAASIARWDGGAWHALGAPALNGGVDAIAYDGGKVYAAGQFTDAGGDTNANYLAVWDGTSWKPFCAPITASVAALQVI